MISLFVAFFQVLLWGFSTGNNFYEAFLPEVSNQISVRESTIDLQIRVDHKIFVFGKESGNLEKVKVGMDVLPFVQIPGIEGYEIDFHRLSWKRTKEGQIQIRGKYGPKAIEVIWTIFPDGKLKMETSKLPQAMSDLLGFGFDLDQSQLLQASWENAHFEPESVVFDAQTALHPVEIGKLNSMQLDFAEVKVGIKTETVGTKVLLKFPDSSIEGPLDPDLRFLFPSNTSLISSNDHISPGQSSTLIGEEEALASSKIILWFDFHQ
ncbi:hypothetical protein [Algoriphagus vanfongensis]|uniref:hypothetical protein n=1 Tax=Algoriphagus vanfongensis TaxID=426371 RepID=UPI0004183239|nr:hypothetical protein [Algoriphagus vanfongensis]